MSVYRPVPVFVAYPVSELSYNRVGLVNGCELADDYTGEKTEKEVIVVFVNYWSV